MLLVSTSSQTGIRSTAESCASFVIVASSSESTASIMIARCSRHAAISTEQLPQVAAWANEIGAVGFRSPSTHRVFDWLGELPLEYDCTIPHSDPYEPIPGGTCTPWPFFIGDVIELPYTLPQDHTLFTILNQRTIDTWVRQAHRLKSASG